MSELSSGGGRLTDDNGRVILSIRNIRIVRDADGNKVLTGDVDTTRPGPEDPAAVFCDLTGASEVSVAAENIRRWFAGKPADNDVAERPVETSMGEFLVKPVKPVEFAKLSYRLDDEVEMNEMKEFVNTVVIAASVVPRITSIGGNDSLAIDDIPYQDRRVIFDEATGIQIVVEGNVVTLVPNDARAADKDRPTFAVTTWTGSVTFKPDDEARRWLRYLLVVGGQESAPALYEPVEYRLN